MQLPKLLYFLWSKNYSVYQRYMYQPTSYQTDIWEITNFTILVMSILT